MIDGSQAAKRRLTEEGELFYIRTCENGVPTVEFFYFSNMQYYANVIGDNLTQNVLHELLSLINKSHKVNEVDLIEAVDTSRDSL